MNALLHSDFGWVPYLLLMLLEFTALGFTMMFLIAYIAKYVFRPRLTASANIRTGVLGL